MTIGERNVLRGLANIYKQFKWHCVDTDSGDSNREGKLTDWQGFSTVLKTMGKSEVGQLSIEISD